MRHGKHQHTLVATQEHRKAMLSNLATALFNHGRIETTLAKAKGLRPFAEKIITMAKKAKADKTRAIAMKKLALTYVRNEDAIHTLFTKRVEEFTNRVGGYSRIYKLGRRVNDAAEMAIIELVPASDEGRKCRSKRAAAPKAEVAPKAEAKEVKAEKSDKKAKK